MLYLKSLLPFITNSWYLSRSEISRPENIDEEYDDCHNDIDGTEANVDEDGVGDVNHIDDDENGDSYIDDKDS